MFLSNTLESVIVKIDLMIGQRVLSFLC